MKVFVITTMILAVAMAAPGIMDNKIDTSDGTFTRMAKIFDNCSENGELGTCLAIKGITALNRATRSNSIEIIPGITFTRDQSAISRSGKSMSENEIVSSLPVSSEEKTGRLIDMAVDSITEFIKTHNLQVKVPAEATQEFARAIDEGRGKMKKLMGPIVLAIGAKLLLLAPLLLGGLALLAAKALIVAKIAFVLAAILGFQKLAAGGSALGKLSGLGGSGGQGWGAPSGGWSAGTQGWSSGSSAYPYARSLDSQEIAYNAQMPQSS